MMRMAPKLGLVILMLGAAPALGGPADDPGAMIARMAKVGSCWSPSFSPDGRRIAFVSNLGGLPQVWIAAAEGGWPEPATALDDPVGSVWWSPAGDRLAFDLAPGGGMNTQVYTVRPDGTDLRRLTDGGKATNFLGGWSHDGEALMVASNRRTPAGMDAYLVGPDGGQWRLVADVRGIGGLVDVSHDGRLAVLNRLVQRGDNNLALVDLRGGPERALTPHEGPASFASAAFVPDGRTIYLSSNRDRDRAAFARILLDADGQPGPIDVVAARDDAELSGLKIDDQGKTAALIWNVAGRSELALVDLATGHSTLGPALPAEIAAGVVFSKDGSRLALTISGPAAPLDIWTWDLRDGRLHQVTHSPHAGVDLGSLVRPSLVTFRAHDGLELSGWLYRPVGAKGPGPVVLSFHGGPEGQERPVFDATYQALLARGIAVFAPNVRGSAGFGKRFVNLDNGPKRFDGVCDIKDCVDYVVASGMADPKRVGIMGGSYGGYMVMAGLTEYPDLFAAAADLFGIVNFATFFARTEPWMAAISKVEYGDPDSQADLLRRLSPIHKIDRVRAATLVLHGANDTNVPVVEAEQVVASLKGRGVPVEYVLFPDEGHGFRKASNRVRSATAIVGWFEEHLKARRSIATPP
jgi:dipeptidyl aminopeptidase/acylaminoacyl peptidase